MATRAVKRGTKLGEYPHIQNTGMYEVLVRLELVLSG